MGCYNSSEKEKKVSLMSNIETIEAHSWDWSKSLTIDEVENTLKNVNYNTFCLFIAPIKYAKCVRVYDGDTIHIAAPIFNGIISRFKVRLAKIDTPELRTKNEWEKSAAVIVKNLLKNKIENKIIELIDVKYDKYGRLLAEVMLNDENINKWLLDSEWACMYDGKGTKLTKSIDWKSKVEEYNAISSTKHK